jgi:uncharacterized membrane protein YbhN (UPF0104 family)
MDRMKALKSWQFWFGLIISALSLYWVLRKIDYAQLWVELRNANYWWILPGVAVYFVALWVRAWRWHYLLRPLKAIPTRAMFPIVAIGYAGNNIFPARAGEVVRAVILKRHEGVPFRPRRHHHRRARLRWHCDAGLRLRQFVRADPSFRRLH